MSGPIFLRYIFAAFDKRYQWLVAEGDGFENDPVFYLEQNTFFIPKNARWNVNAAATHTSEIGKVLDDNKTLKNVLPKVYANPDLDKKVLDEDVNIFTNNIHMDDTEESCNLLGMTYEYCIAQFAEKEGKGGEFYMVRTLVEVLRPFNNYRVYDPCCGSGGTFFQSTKFLQAHGVKRGGDLRLWPGGQCRYLEDSED